MTLKNLVSDFISYYTSNYIKFVILLFAFGLNFWISLKYKSSDLDYLQTFYFYLNNISLFMGILIFLFYIQNKKEEILRLDNSKNIIEHNKDFLSESKIQEQTEKPQEENSEDQTLKEINEEFLKRSKKDLESNEEQEQNSKE